MLLPCAYRQSQRLPRMTHTPTSKLALASAFCSCPTLSRARLTAFLDFQKSAPCRLESSSASLKHFSADETSRWSFFSINSPPLTRKSSGTYHCSCLALQRVQNLIDLRKPLAHFVCLAETSRKLAQQRQKARQEPGVAGLT